MKRMIGPWDCAREMLEALPGGLLLTAKAGEKVNPMTIGWGTLGIEWGTPIFIAFVRQSRYTRQLLDQNPEFTVSAPCGGGAVKEILSLCGTKSGRDTDKVAAAGLTVEPPKVITVPGFRQLPLTLECRVIYRQEQDLGAIEAGRLRRYYPQDVDSSFHGANRDFHVAYYGEILASYVIE